MAPYGAPRILGHCEAPAGPWQSVPRPSAGIDAHIDPRSPSLRGPRSFAADPRLPFRKGGLRLSPRPPKLFRPRGRKIVSNAQSRRTLRGPGTRNGAEENFRPIMRISFYPLFPLLSSASCAENPLAFSNRLRYYLLINAICPDPGSTADALRARGGMLPYPESSTKESDLLWKT